mmetsp:Transcript_22567/g.35168  ORF Transcript_22567/g.35168 Transcript_22567/m.35168 type:complete len:148 (+) Transcript_22567:122-565(+)
MDDATSHMALPSLDLRGAFGTSFCSLETAAQAEAKARSAANARRFSPSQSNGLLDRPTGQKPSESFRFDPIATVVSVEVPAHRQLNWATKQAQKGRDADQADTLKSSAGKLLGNERRGIFNFCCPSNMVKVPKSESSCIPVGEPMRK